MLCNFQETKQVLDQVTTIVWENLYCTRGKFPANRLITMYQPPGYHRRQAVRLAQLSQDQEIGMLKTFGKMKKIVPRTRLELAHPLTGASPSSWCVYQFHHLGGIIVQCSSSVFGVQFSSKHRTKNTEHFYVPRTGLEPAQPCGH